MVRFSAFVLAIIFVVTAMFVGLAAHVQILKLVSDLFLLLIAIASVAWGVLWFFLTSRGCAITIASLWISAVTFAALVIPAMEFTLHRYGQSLAFTTMMGTCLVEILVSAMAAKAFDNRNS